MIIQAKFASTCPSCGGRIDPGARVQWERGQRAAHVACPAASAVLPALPAPSSTIPTPEAAPYQRSEKWEPCKRVALPNTVGQVRIAGGRGTWATPRKGVGGPVQAGEAFRVVAQVARYESAEDNEDMGDCSGPGWNVTLYLRSSEPDHPASQSRTSVAIAVRRSAWACRSRAWEAARAISGAASSAVARNAARCPEGRTLEIDPGVHGSGRKLIVMSPDGGAVAVWCSGYYDDYRWTLHVTRDSEAVAIATKLLGSS